MVVPAPLLAAAITVMATAPGEPLPRSARCPSHGVIETSTQTSPALLLRPQDRRGDAGAQSLASLPPADMHLTVLRSVAGCAVSTIVREKVQGDGRFARPR